MRRRFLSFKKETDLAPIAESYLRGYDCEIYREVTMPSGGRADLVGVAGPLVSAVELKLRLGLEVLAQASNHLEVVHFVWVAVPAFKPADRDVRNLLHEVARWKGIGVLACYAGDEYTPPRWNAEVEPRFNRRARVHETRRLLREEMKTVGVAGTARGGHFTDFKGTCMRLVEYIAAHPGCSMKDAVDNIRHHYSSSAGARAHLARMIEKGVIKGVRLEQDGKARRCWLVK
jgi:hypothetical protein